MSIKFLSGTLQYITDKRQRSTFSKPETTKINKFDLFAQITCCNERVLRETPKQAEKNDQTAEQQNVTACF